MNALNIVEYTHTLGAQAKAASAQMARASAATKSRALLALARLLRENTAPLQTENAKDLDRARAAGLAAPLVDRLKLSPQTLETCAQGCEQLAAMPDSIGEIIGLQQLAAEKITVEELSAQARASSHLLASLPPRYSTVLMDLLDRIEASALFTEESCSFSQSDLLGHLQGLSLIHI